MQLLRLDIILRRLQNPHRRLAILLQLLKEAVPDLDALLILELGVINWHVDARDEGLVKRPHPVGRQKQYPLEVLERTQEAGDEMISIQVLRLPLLHVDVGLVDEHNGAPCLGHLEPGQEVRFDAFRLHPDVCARECEERTSCVLSDAFCVFGQQISRSVCSVDSDLGHTGSVGLAHSGLSMQQKDQTVPFALDVVG